MFSRRFGAICLPPPCAAKGRRDSFEPDGLFAGFRSVFQALGPGGVLLHSGGAGGLIGPVGQDIDLDLGLGARGTDNQAGAVGQLVAGSDTMFSGS